jgi:acetyl esterase
MTRNHARQSGPVHPEAQAVIDRALASDEPPLEMLLPSEARRISDTRVSKMVIPSPPMEQVVDLSFPCMHGEMKLRLFRPSAQPLLPLTLFFHGGGFMFGNLETHDALCRALAAASGSVVVAVDFRRSPEHRFPAAPDDCIVATRWALQNAATLGIDPSRFAVAGESSGGNLATVVAQQLTLTKGPRPKLQVLLLPVVELSVQSESYQKFANGFLLTRARCEFYFNSYLQRAEDACDPRASPLRAKSLAGLPPAFIIAAGLDPSLSDTEAYVGRLREAGVVTQYQRFDGWTHGFIFWGATQGSQAAIAQAGDALRVAFG